MIGIRSALPTQKSDPSGAVDNRRLINVLFKPGVTDNVAHSTKAALADLELTADAVSTCRKYWVNADAADRDLEKLARRVLANDAIQQVIWGPLAMDGLSLGSTYHFRRMTVPIRGR